jgi:K+-sensing histidine kinase KdpD
MAMSGSRNDTLVAHKLQVLTAVARTLAAHLELTDLLQSVLDEITQVIEPAEAAFILLWDPSTELLRTHVVAGGGLHDADAALSIRLQAGESITGRVFASGEAVLLRTPDEVAREMANLHPSKQAALSRAYGSNTFPSCAIAVPLHTDEQKYGVLVLENLEGHGCFTDEDMSFIQAIADLIALEIDRARLDAETATLNQAKQADRLRSEVMAALSHELRTPLAAIKGYASALMLEEVDWPEEKQLQFLRMIEEETDTLERMVSDIMDASLIDIGQLPIELQPVRLPPLAQEVAEEMQHMARGHHFVVAFPPDFPIVDADPRRIRQVLRNIVDNAVKYSPNGGLIVLRGEVRASDVVVSISDQGVGISPEDLIPLFDKYFRVKAPTGYHVPGTGLGLPVARAIVETHGGRIWAESKVGEGTTLYFSIPLADRERQPGYGERGRHLG